MIYRLFNRQILFFSLAFRRPRLACSLEVFVIDFIHDIIHPTQVCTGELGNLPVTLQLLELSLTIDLAFDGASQLLLTMKLFNLCFLYAEWNSIDIFSELRYLLLPELGIGVCIGLL